MPLALEEDLKAELVDLRFRVPDITGALVATTDGLLIVDERTGVKPTFGGALTRWGFPMGLGLVTCYIGSILVYISPFFDNTGKLRGWHDRAANTLVIKP